MAVAFELGFNKRILLPTGILLRGIHFPASAEYKVLGNNQIWIDQTDTAEVSRICASMEPDRKGSFRDPQVVLGGLQHASGLFRDSSRPFPIQSAARVASKTYPDPG